MDQTHPAAPGPSPLQARRRESAYRWGRPARLSSAVDLLSAAEKASDDSLVHLRSPRVPKGGITTITRGRPGREITRYRVRLGRYSETFESHAAAARALEVARLRRTRGQDERNPNRIAFRDACLLQLQRRQRRGTKQRSLRCPEGQLRNWILPFADRLTLAEANQEQTMFDFLAELQVQVSPMTGKPLKPSVQQSVLQVWSSVLDLAVSRGWLEHNVIRDEDLGRHLKPAEYRNMPDALVRGLRSVEQATRYLSAALASDLSYAPAFAFKLLTGLRFGELFGLLVENVHLEGRAADGQSAPYIDVLTQAAPMEPGHRPLVQQPRGRRRLPESIVITTQLKTPASRRRVYLPTDAVAIVEHALARRTAAQLATRHWDSRHDLVFCTRYGTPVSGDTVRGQHRALCTAAGVPQINPHGLRHTTVALLLAAAVPIEEVRRSIGHETVDEIIKVYAYVMSEFDRRGAEALSRLLAPRLGGSL